MATKTDNHVYGLWFRVVAIRFEVVRFIVRVCKCPKAWWVGLSLIPRPSQRNMKQCLVNGLQNTATCKDSSCVHATNSIKSRACDLIKFMEFRHMYICYITLPLKEQRPRICHLLYCTKSIASSPGHSQILSRSRGEKSGEGLVPLLRHGPEMVDSVST